LTPLAQVAARGAAVFPGLTARLLHVFAATLPAEPATRSDLAEGGELRPAIPQRIFDRATALARSAARRLNEIPRGGV
jgi:hypothetical protein